MQPLIDFLIWLDVSDVAYLLMVILFIIMGRMYDGLHKENIRLRKLLVKAVIGEK